jgi:hypothetical protein
MKLQKAPVINCHYNQIGFPQLDNVNRNFVNKLTPKPHFMFSSMDLKVPKFQDLVCTTIMHMNNLFKDVKMQSIIFN